MMAAKSRSTVAALLVVVVVAMSASGAHAASSGNVDLVNTCDIDAFIMFTDAVTAQVVKAGQTLGIPLGFLQGVIGPVNITLGVAVYAFPVLTGTVVKVEIICNTPACAPNQLAIKPYLLGSTQPLATLCVDVIVS